MFIRPELVRGSAANSAVRLGLLGCGGRGTGVAESFVKNAGARITALGDMFPDNLERAQAHLKTGGAPAFHGPKAYEQLFSSNAIDAV